MLGVHQSVVSRDVPQDQVLKILGLIASGYSYEQILLSHGEYSYKDIFSAAEQALMWLREGTEAQRRLAQWDNARVALEAVN